MVVPFDGTIMPAGLLSASDSVCNFWSFLFGLNVNDSGNLLIHTNTALFGLTV